MNKSFLAERVNSVLSVVFVFVFGVVLFSCSGGNVYAANDGGWLQGKSATVTGSELSNAKISTVIASLMRWLLYLVGFLAVIAFVISGILYLTAAGDDERIERAKTAMIYAIVGVIVALMGLIIINAVDSWLGGDTSTY